MGEWGYTYVSNLWVYKRLKCHWSISNATSKKNILLDFSLFRHFINYIQQILACFRHVNIIYHHLSSCSSHIYDNDLVTDTQTDICAHASADMHANIRGAHGVTVVVEGVASATRVHILDKVNCILHSANTLGKGISPTILQLWLTSRVDWTL